MVYGSDAEGVLMHGAFDNPDQRSEMRRRREGAKVEEMGTLMHVYWLRQYILGLTTTKRKGKSPKGKQIMISDY